MTFADATEVQSGPLVTDGGVQCQTGTPGATLTFLFKDGLACRDSAEVSAVEYDARITCAPRPLSIPSCTGNEAGKECIWTVTLPTTAYCTIFGDPHVRSFDELHAAYMEEGDVWLVKNKHVFIQGRFARAKKGVQRSFLVGVVVGGPFLDGNTLTIGAGNEHASWNEEQILHSMNTSFHRKINGEDVEASFLEKARTINNARRATRGVRARLPGGVTLHIDHFDEWLGLKIMQKHELEGGQDGVCGNFNGRLKDDKLQALASRMDVH
eukprot:5999731-Amphidinium_carterae.1